MQATGALSSHDLQRSLGHLAKKLARLRASDAPPRAITSQRRRARRPGWVQDAVVRVLADHEGPMRPMLVHAAIEALLGEAVSPDSVGWALASEVRGPAPCFVRVARGRYVLATAALRQTEVGGGGSPSGEADVSVCVSSSGASSGAITSIPRGSRASCMRLS